MVAGRQPRLERHRGRDPGAAGGRASAARPIRRAVVALRAFQNRDGGFSLTKGRESDAQSTAWAIQALLSAGRSPASRRSATCAACGGPTAATAIRSATGRRPCG